MPFLRRHWFVSLLAATAILLAVFHQPILRGIGGALVYDDPIERCDTLFVVGGDRDYAVAAELYGQKKATRIALLRGLSKPLVLCKIVEPDVETNRREIRKRGVPEDAIVVAPGEITNIWEIGDRVRDRLVADPDERIGMLVDRFYSERLHWTLKQELSESELVRVRIHALRDRRFNETNWWRHRLGITNVASTYIRHAYNVFGGRPARFEPPKGEEARSERGRTIAFL